VAPARARISPAERRERKASETDPAVVLAAGVRLLEARPRSVADVRRRLRGSGYQARLVEDAVERLLELGFLDDEAFARSWAESRDRARPRGERALRSELMAHGVDRATIDAVLADREPPDGSGTADTVAAEALLAGHARALARVADPRVRRQRAYALLARNGFDPDVASRVARTVAIDPIEEIAPE
jgi:regulatory protein